MSAAAAAADDVDDRDDDEDVRPPAGGDEDDGEESEDVGAFWGDELVEKQGHFKAVLAKVTVKGSVAIAKRDKGAFLLFKGLEAQWALDQVAFYVSWGKAKSKVRATWRHLHTLLCVCKPCSCCAGGWPGRHGEEASQRAGQLQPPHHVPRAVSWHGQRPVSPQARRFAKCV